jgi:hypothetical protein
MQSKQCAACGAAFRPRPQVPTQCYCAAPACQRERRRRWQQAKRKRDPDYYDNQTRAHRAWRERNPDYSREYRSQHPDYVENNRERQRDRNRERRASRIARMEVSVPVLALPSGLYHISPVPRPGIAKKMGRFWCIKGTQSEDTHQFDGRIDHRVSAWSQIVRSEVPARGRPRPNENWCLWILCASSIPVIVTTALANDLKPRMGPHLCLIAR